MKIPIKILIVEDDTINQKIIYHYLSDYEVVVAGCGEDAIKICEANNFDLVLMDIRLGFGIDGIQTFKEINGYKDIPVLAVTAFAMNGDKEYFLQAGFDGYLAKPFNKETFIEFIKEYII